MRDFKRFCYMENCCVSGLLCCRICRIFLCCHKRSIRKITFCSNAIHVQCLITKVPTTAWFLLQPLVLPPPCMRLKPMATPVPTLILKRMREKFSTWSNGKAGRISTAHGRARNPCSSRKWRASKSWKTSRKRRRRSSNGTLYFSQWFGLERFFFRQRFAEWWLKTFDLFLQSIFNPKQLFSVHNIHISLCLLMNVASHRNYVCGGRGMKSTILPLAGLRFGVADSK